MDKKRNLFLGCFLILSTVFVWGGGRPESVRSEYERSENERDTRIESDGSMDGAPAPSVFERQGERNRMVEGQIKGRGVKNGAVLNAMREIPRHYFVPEEGRSEAYNDYPLPIGYGQTISQPYIVAYMTELLAPLPDHKVLEVGTGSGYQAAILAAIVSKVCTVEIIPELLTAAVERFHALGYGNIAADTADGYYGWPEEAPFDGIVVTAAAEHVPPALIAQLKPGGRLIIPVGSAFSVQTIILLEKHPDGRVERKPLLPVRFVPMTGAVQRGQ